MTSQSQINALRRQAAELRWRIVGMMGPNKAHHFGGSLSAADIVTALYFYRMRYDPANPTWPDRDRFVMSKGHSVPAQYAALAMLGVFPLEELATLKYLGSRLQGHPAMHYTPGIEACTGALGEGLSFANGVALAARVQKKSYRVYCLLGDGELHEGQVWEAAMTSVKQCLGNLVAIIDRNRLKAMDATECGKILDPLAPRWASIGWAVKEVDGHDMAALCDALDWADGQVDQPSMIIANTVKGKGVSFMAGQAGFHNAPITEEQYRQAVAELELAMKEQAQ
ncbi:MAG: transketolase [Acidobacteriia bacterium]|jgi:transketolase|nr:transketolase [Terriglobia bacterium]